MKFCYPILPVADAKAYESSVLKEDSEQIATAMQNAGKAIGAALHNDYREIRPWPARPLIHVLAGKGLNTGDALVACEGLFAELQGLQVRMIATAGEAELSPLVKTVLGRLKAAMGDAFTIQPVADYLKTSDSAVDVVLDGLFGTGFHPPLNDAVRGLLRHVNGLENVRLRASVDVPSGIGESTDPDSFVADFTYIPGVAKAPCFDNANASFVGRIRFLEIDPFMGQSDSGQLWQVASPKAFNFLNRLRPSRSDKRTFGHCLVLAGSSYMPGAAQMSTLSALQAGAGLVTTLTPVTVAGHICSAVPEAMWRPLPLTPDGGLDVEVVRIVSQLSQRAHAMLIGPGLYMDRATVFAICRIIRETPLPMVIDASALTQDIIAAVLGRPLTAGPVVITPHRGEYERILGMKEDPNDPNVLLNFSNKYRVITILKGSPTLICDGKHFVQAPSGGPILARGGSGDLLSGILVALLARESTDPLSAAIQAVTWQGAAADSLARMRGSIAVTTTELLPHFGLSLRS